MNEIVTQIGAVAVAMVAAYQAIRLERMRKESKRKDVQIKESSKNFSALSLLVDFELISTVYSRVDEVFRNTNIDRFLLIIAVNGRDVFNVVSVVYERHRGRIDEGGRRVDINAIGRYSHIRIDSDYKDMLHSVETKGRVMVVTDQMTKDSMLYNIYDLEGVTAAAVYPVTRMRIDDHNDMLLFCSYATHSPTLISRRDSSFIQTLHGGIQSAFKSYADKIDGFAAKLDDDE
jgi:hypothetical protein